MGHHATSEAPPENPTESGWYQGEHGGWWRPQYANQDLLEKTFKRDIGSGLSPDAYQDYIEGIKAGGDKYGGYGYIRTPHDTGPESGMMFGGGHGKYYTLPAGDVKKRMMDLLGYGPKESGGEGISRLIESGKYLGGGEDTGGGGEATGPHLEDLHEASAIFKSMDPKYDPKYSGGKKVYPKGPDQEDLLEAIADLPPRPINYKGNVGFHEINRGGYDSEEYDRQLLEEEQVRSRGITNFLRNISGFGAFGEGSQEAYEGYDPHAEIDYSTLSGNYREPLRQSPTYTNYILQLLSGVEDVGFGELPINDPVHDYEPPPGSNPTFPGEGEYIA